MGSGSRNGTEKSASGGPAPTVAPTGNRVLLRIAATVVVVAVAVGLTPSPAGAAPRRPSDGDIATAQARADAVADEIGRLSGRLTEAQASVDAARAASAIALDEHQATQEAFEAAQAHAATAAAAAAQAAGELGSARGEHAEFARHSYMEGSTSPGAAALVSAGDPAELIERAALLEAAGGHRTDVLVRVTELTVVADRADAVARIALAEADTLQITAAATLDVARAAEISARAHAATVAAEQAEVQQQLVAAHDQLQALVGARAAAERTAAVAPAPAPVPRPAPVPTSPPSAPPTGGTRAGSPPAAAGPGDGSAAQQAIDAALAYLGTPYAWGGGGTRGPGPGQDPDEGVVGFDCSGLTQYAYAQAGIAIPRNSRAQYAGLPQVPSDDLRPGDLVFWGTDPEDPSSITHVALYLGDDQVVQAPQSADAVKVSPMWWRGYVGAVRPSA